MTASDERPTPAEPKEEDPPDETDSELASIGERVLTGPDWSGDEPPEPGATGPDLLNAARDTLIGDELSRLSDAELFEQALASRDLASMATGRQYRTLAELLRRRQPRRAARLRAEGVSRSAVSAVAANTWMPSRRPPRYSWALS